MNLLLIALAVMAGSIQAQPQQAPASIEGLVVKLGTGEPLAGASVQLNTEVSRSDANGHFIFENVAPGEYRLIATYDGGYVPAEYGQRSPTGEGIPFEIAAGQKMTGIQLAMPPTGAISGRVYDRDGEPLGKALVLALQPVYKNGRRTMTIVQTVESDDRGEYRLYWLAPGRYFIGAKPDIAELSMTMGAPGSYNAGVVHVTPPTRFGTFEQGTNPSVNKRRLKTGVVVEEMYVPVYYPNTIDFVRDPDVIGISTGYPLFKGSLDNGSFTIEKILPGDFRMTFQGLPPDGYIKSIRLGNTDVLNDGLHISGPPDAALEIVIGANAGRIDGSVVNPRNEPLSNRTVVLAPDFRLRQRSDLYRVVSTDATGRFRIQGITPGDYKLFAWENVEPGAWQNPDFIQGYENAGHPVRINEGSNESLQLPAIP